MAFDGDGDGDGSHSNSNGNSNSNSNSNRHSNSNNNIGQGSAVWTHDIGSLVAEYVAYLEIMQHFREELPRRTGTGTGMGTGHGRIVDVSYEALIASPESVMRSIVTDKDVLGLEWDPRVMHHTESNRSVRTSIIPDNIYHSKSWQKYSTQLQPLLKLLRGHMPRLKALNAWPEQYKL